MMVYSIKSICKKPCFSSTEAWNKIISAVNIRPDWYNRYSIAMNNGDLLSPYQTKVTQPMRSEIKEHAPAVLWFTGLSGSGKSVIANLVEVALNRDFHAHTYLLDGDNFRRGLNADLGFSLANRTENIRRAGEVAKLMMLLEKLEEICYLNWCRNPKYQTILFDRPIDLVAHGGQPTKVASFNKTSLLDTLGLAFSSIQMKAIGSGEQSPNGVVFGVKNLSLIPDSIFVEIEHDWEDIRSRLVPLIKNVLGQIS
jgi:hypothetical protein